MRIEHSRVHLSVMIWTLCTAAMFGCGETFESESESTHEVESLGGVSGKEDGVAQETPTNRLSESLNMAIDAHRNDVQAWVNVTRIERSGSSNTLRHLSYGQSSKETDFWPASVIKMYTATAGLELLSDWGFSIDAVATFYRQNRDGEWIEEVSMSFRELIRRTFDCSSNITYTLLLRLAGVDWLNSSFFPKYGMDDTALMRGYVRSSDRPYGYEIWAPQRIVITDSGRQVERIHQYSGVSHADAAGCTIWNTNGTGNCTSPMSMSEHLRRIVMHDELPVSERFSIRNDLMNWYRGEAEDLVLNNIAGEDCGGPVLEGVQRVFETPKLLHKEGLVSEYRGSVHYVRDEQSQTEYVAAVMLKSPDARLLSKVSEEIARVIRDDGHYVHLDTLRDYVNPITAELMVNTSQHGTLELMLKPYDEAPYGDDGWFSRPGLNTQVHPGLNAYRLISDCHTPDGTYHVKAVLKDQLGDVLGVSDLHYVIIASQDECEAG